MMYKKNRRGLVLVTAVACAFGLPGVALAGQPVSETSVSAFASGSVTYDYTVSGTDTYGAASFNKDATAVVVHVVGAGEATSVDLTDGWRLHEVVVDGGGDAGTVNVSVADDYTGNITLEGDNASDIIVRADGDKVASGAGDYAVGEGVYVGALSSDYTELKQSNNEAEEDEVNGYLEQAGDTLTSIKIDNDEITSIDFSENGSVTYLRVTGTDITNIDGLEEMSGEVEISASSLSEISLGGNDDITSLDIRADITSLDASGMDELTDLDVSSCLVLDDLDVSDDENLDHLDISSTQLATLDTSGTDITKVGDNGLDYGAYITLADNQYADVSVNSDNDDYYDYVFDLDDLTGNQAQNIVSSDSAFTVAFSSSAEYDSSNYIDMDSGELTITASEEPKSIVYQYQTDIDDNPGVVLKVKFNVSQQKNRISGYDRYATMVAIDTNESRQNFDEVFKTGTSKPQDVVVASGESYADALAASSLAGALDTGIVTTKIKLSDETVDMLEVMDTQGTAYVVGGTSAVSAQTVSQLTDLGFGIVRYAGTDRYATAVEVQKAIQDLDAGNDTVIVASGENYPDALAIAPYAYTQNIPIVLVDASGNMKNTTSEFFNANKSVYSKAIIVGGTAVVSEDVATDLQDYGLNVIRLAGSDRYETNLVINEWLDRGDASISETNKVFTAAGYSKADISALNAAGIHSIQGANTYDSTAYVVTGKGFADALAVAPLAGVKHGVITMVSGSDVSTIDKAKSEGSSAIIVGGTAVISSALAGYIEDL